MYLTESGDKQRVFSLDSYSSSLIYSTSQFLINLDLRPMQNSLHGSPLGVLRGQQERPRAVGQSR